MFESVDAQYLRNGAMEGPVTGNNTPPDDWGICDIVASSPELRDTFIRNPDTIISPDLSKFTLLRVRGENNNPAGTVEHLFTNLITPLERGYCYVFSAWLYHTYNGSYNPPTEPVKLQLWGSLDSCSMDEMLYESELIITGDSWRQYEFQFVVENNDYPYFYIQPYWDFENVSEDFYDGVIMMDNLDIQQVKPVDLGIIDTVYFSLDPPLQLRASPGTGYSWIPPEVVSDDEDRDPLMLEYVDMIDVLVRDEDFCPVRERYIVLLDCDSLYKNAITNEYEVYFSLQNDIILSASAGNSYNWDPQTNLSDYTIQNPTLLDYHDNYLVQVEDQYGCIFNEEFNIIADCDTMYPEKSFYTLDTVIFQGAEIILQPVYGEPTGFWSPMTGLSCVECRSPAAFPTSSVVYQIELSDQFNCIHEELFAIEINLEFPNVITPNNDGFNDEFIVQGLPPGSSMHIYNRDGSLIYSNTNYGHPIWWRGVNNKGEAVSSGNYWYVLEIPRMNLVRKDFIFVKR